MDIRLLSELLAAMATFAIACSVVLRDRTRQQYNRFAVFCLNLCLWYSSRFLQAKFDFAVLQILALLLVLAIPVTSLRFFRTLLDREPRRAAPLPRALIVFAWLLASVIIYGFNLHHNRVFWAIVMVYIYGGLAWSLLVIYGAWRRTLSRLEKTRLIYLLVGGAMALILSATALLPQVSPGWPTAGNILVIGYMFFLSQTLFRYRLLDLHELLAKVIVLTVFSIILAAIFGLLVAWLPSREPTLFFFVTFIGSLVVLILFEPLRNFVEVQVNRLVLREKWELTRRVDELRFALTNIVDAREAASLVTRILGEARRLTHAAVYFADSDGTGFDLYGYLGPKPVEHVDTAARRVFIERLIAERGGVPLTLGELEREQAKRLPDDAENEAVAAVARSLAELQAGVCVPIMAEDQLLGLFCLKDERLREAYTQDEIDLFRSLARQLAVTLQSSKAYARMKERDRLAALGEMAAGLAHEIRNPLGAIKGAAQLLTASPEGGAAVDTAEFLQIITEEVNRLNNVVSQFLDYARPYRGAEDPIDVNEVVRRTMQLLPAQAQVEISFELQAALPPVRGDADQLRQVFLNLALNALEAMPEGGKLTIATTQRREPRGGEVLPRVEIRFRDTGAGIPPAEMETIFIPFHTTKPKGTGLGLPISQRIVENHGGHIEARSRLGQGSTFTVVLPVMAKVALLTQP